jgi:hypothetical protein
MKYFDRSGEQIKLPRWQELIRDPGYTTVLEDETPQRALHTCWIGVMADIEKIPLLFLTEYDELRHEKDGYRWETVESVWHTTEEGAIAEHHGLVQQYFPKGRKHRA